MTYTSTFDIYHLSDPRDQSVRYVGMSKDAHVRLQRHLYQKDNPLAPWFKELAEQGHKPTLTIIETVEGKQQAKERELFWITYYSSQGAHLENYHGNTDARSAWKEREEWLTYLTKEYSFIEDPQEQQLVIAVYLKIFLSRNMRYLMEISDTVLKTTDEIQRNHQMTISWGEVARILAKICDIHRDGSEAEA